jgi:hypothetical protein
MELLVQHSVYNLDLIIYILNIVIREMYCKK